VISEGCCTAPFDPSKPARRTITRRAVIATVPFLAIVARHRAQAETLIASQPTVDTHSHAGRIVGVRNVEEHRGFSSVAAPMRSGGMSAVCLAIVSDSPCHKVMPDGRIHPYRVPEAGELYRFGIMNFERLHDLIRRESLTVITSATQLSLARPSNPSAIVTAEGGDFLEGQLDRVDEAYERYKLRQLQLTHYRVNELGDIQTETPAYNGLTDFGADVIRRCNTLGIVVDVAHGTYDLVKRAASVSTKPLLLSHTSLSKHPGERSRLISPDHARVIAATGGLIGIWPPASIFADLRAMARGMARIADIVGVDHVGLGTDMLGLVGPSAFDRYERLPDLARALLETGFSGGDVSKILGGNYVRVFAATMGTKAAA
jgi:membrane dipeptidase